MKPILQRTDFGDNISYTAQSVEFYCEGIQFLAKDGDKVLFREEVLGGEGISYADGDFFIEQPGTYVVSLEMMTSLSWNGIDVTFAFAYDDNRILLSSNNTRGQLSGSAILVVEDGGLTFSVINACGGNNDPTDTWEGWVVLDNTLIGEGIIANIIVFQIDDGSVALDGKDGKSIRILGTTTTPHDPTELYPEDEAPHDGDVYIDVDGLGYVYDAGAWRGIGRIRGLDGAAGEPGTQGPTGPLGPMGRIKDHVGSFFELPSLEDEDNELGDTYLDDAGNVYVLEVDGEGNWYWHFVGNLKGPAGPTGPTGASGTDGKSFRIVGHVGSKAELPDEAEDGDVYVDDETGDGYVYDEESGWKYIGKLRGPVGPTGPTGPVGPKGDPAEPCVLKDPVHGQSQVLIPDIYGPGETVISTTLPEPGTYIVHWSTVSATTQRSITALVSAETTIYGLPALINQPQIGSGIIQTSDESELISVINANDEPLELLNIIDGAPVANLIFYQICGCGCKIDDE